VNRLHIQKLIIYFQYIFNIFCLGLRSALGAGFSKMNDLTVIQATQVCIRLVFRNFQKPFFFQKRWENIYQLIPYTRKLYYLSKLRSRKCLSMVILHFLMFVFVLVVPGFVQIFTNTI